MVNSFNWRSRLPRLTQPFNLVMAALVSIFAAAPFFAAKPAQETRYFVRLAIQSSVRTSAQLFYDVGRGINEEDSCRQALRPSERDVEITFPLATGKLRSLRFDPLDGPGSVQLGELRITDGKTRILCAIPANQFRPANNLVVHPQTNSGSVVQFTATGDDPSLEIPLPTPLLLSEETSLMRRFANALAPGLVVFLVTLLFIGLLLPAKSEDSSTEPVTTPESKQSAPTKWLLRAALLLVGLKLWLVAGQTVYAIVDSGHDDQLFIRLAYNILDGRWLGQYSQFTLMKGAIYSLFIAGVFVLGIPLFTAQHLLYTAACGLLVRALRPFRLSPWLLFGLFAVLLFNPATFDTNAHTRVLRQQILAPLAFAIIAAGIALYARRKMSVRKSLPWALLAGAALPLFWMTREDGIWFVPAIILLWGALGLSLWRERPPHLASRISLLLLPFALWAGGIYTVAWLNHNYYGIFTTCEFKHPSFKGAYGALLRIQSDKKSPQVSIPREVRQLAYRASPAFAELEPYLEGSLARSWGVDPATGVYVDGLFVWALRDAVFMSGHASSGREAMDFYARIAREIDTACNRGQLPSGPARSGFQPSWRSEFSSALPGTFKRAILFFTSYTDMSVAPQPSYGAAQNYIPFKDITRARITPPESAPPIPRRQHWLDDIRIEVLGNILAVYKFFAPWAAAASTLALVTSLVIALRKRILPYFLVVAIAFFGICLGLVLICTLVEIMSFPAIFTMYFTAAYGVWLLFHFVSWIALFRTLQAKRPGCDPAAPVEHKPKWLPLITTFIKQVLSPAGLRWFAIGIVFAVIGLGLITLFVSVLTWPFWIATALSGEIGTILRFLAVDRLVFGHRRPSWKRLLQYHIANALGFGIWWTAANVLQAAGLQYLLASIAAMVFSVCFNFLMNFWWIWRPTRKPA